MSTIDSNVLSPEKQAAAGAGTLAPLDVTSSNPSWACAAGAGISTTADLPTYVEALVGGGLLSPTMQKIRLDSIRSIDPAGPQGRGYGLPLGRFGPFYGHLGELTGFNTFTGYDPDRNYGGGLDVARAVPRRPRSGGRDGQDNHRRAVRHRELTL